MNEPSEARAEAPPEAPSGARPPEGHSAAAKNLAAPQPHPFGASELEATLAATRALLERLNALDAARSGHPQPPPAEEHSGEGFAEAFEEAAQEARTHFDVSTRRRLIGYGWTFAAAFGILLLATLSLSALSAVEVPKTPEELRFVTAKLLAKAVVTAALVGFFLKMLRMGERMTVPPWWDVDFARLMLGERDLSWKQALKVDAEKRKLSMESSGEDKTSR